MNDPVPRTCTELRYESGRTLREASQPLARFREVPAYVLLGDPGSGKTTAFECECGALGSGRACRIPARDFLAFDENNHPEWKEKILFIDGLDEVRANQSNVAIPFDQVRRLLDKLRPPGFRLSCRAADWLGVNDQKNLRTVAPGGEVRVLLLDKLSDFEIKQILKSYKNTFSIQTFIEKTREQGIEELLRNPLTLNMFTEAIAPDGGWPKSRLEIFEKACAQMIQEHDEGHSLSMPLSAPSELLAAAGHLSVIQLIAGIDGYTPRAGQPTSDYPALNECGYDPKKIERVVKTKLFTDSGNCIAPVHRHIAEFVGAKYLSQLISNGLPTRRVLSLMTGWDGIVVTELRGLSAWLATLCEGVKSDLIECDPIGVALYGDISNFSTEEKQNLLKSLWTKTHALFNTPLARSAFDPLATPDMETAITAILVSPSRDKEHQKLTEFILDILTDKAVWPSLREVLNRIVRDDTWWPRINVAALDALIRCCHNDDLVDDLKELLTDILGGTVSDPSKRLLGTLLIELYPCDLPPDNLWNHLSMEESKNSIGQYVRKWADNLCEESPATKIAEILDDLVKKLPEWHIGMENHNLEDFPLKLLARGLEEYGDTIAVGRLYDWLGVGSAFKSDGSALFSVRGWLAKHPEIQKTIFMEVLKRHLDSDAFEIYSDVEEHLYDSQVPSDFGIWCLNEAVSITTEGSPAEEYVLKQALQAQIRQIGNEGLSFDLLKKRAQTNKTLQEIMDDVLSPNTALPRLRLQKGNQIKKDELLDSTRLNKTELHENTAEPNLLFRIARVYFDYFRTFRKKVGSNAIQEWLQDDQDLIQPVLKGLRGVINRQDVPDGNRILSLRRENKISLFSLPFLAALAEIEKTKPNNWIKWDDSQIEKALLFYYTTPHGDYWPQWYKHLLEKHPKTVASIQIRFAISEFQDDREHIYKLWELAHDSSHAEVAKLACLPLLRAFPTRCKNRLLKTLGHLLWAAIQYADRNALLKLVEKKTSQTSATVGQQAYWLAAGSIVSPEKYRESLQDFMRGKQNRIMHLVEFLHLDDCLATKFDRLPILISKTVVHLIGGHIGPGLVFTEKGGLVRFVIDASELVHKQIHRLAASDTQDASKALNELLANPELALWHDILLQAYENQKIVCRDAGYRHPNIEQICQTLQGGLPANACDLWALTTDRLHEIGKQFSSGSADGWRQCWNEDMSGKPVSPKHENSCRDAILSALRESFQYKIDSQRESSYNREKRADIRVSYQGFNVPIEIKKNSHRDLWSAIRNQLIQKYLIDPGTDGYGIYLVLWFGKDQTQLPPSGPPPADPESLEKQLNAMLSENEARKISICVVDVSEKYPSDLSLRVQ